MGTKRERVLPVDCHRPVDWNEKAVQKVLDTVGYVYAQTKKDGIRFHAFIDAYDTVRIVTREGIEIKSLEWQKERLRGLLQALPKAYYVDGEVVVPGVPFEVGSGILRRYSVIPDTEPVEFWVWDTAGVGTLIGEVIDSTPYSQRMDDLVRAFGATPDPQARVVPTEAVTSLEELDELFDKQREMGEEGLVVKDPNSLHRNGKVTGAWKMKPSDTCDGRITGVLWGTPGLGNAGKIIGFTVELEDGTLCDCDGLTQALMTEFTRLNGMDGGRLTGRYVEVSYMERTAKGSLRHPKFKTFRDLDYSPGWKC